MSELPITKSDYDKATLMINFLTEFKQRISEMNNVEDVIFTPQIKCYIISFTYNTIPHKIVLSVNRGIFTTKLKVEYMVADEWAEVFIAKSKDENQDIINQIVVDLLKKGNDI